MKNLPLMILLVALCSGATLAAAQSPAGPTQTADKTWRIDATHSELSFRIRHLVSRVRGSFGSWSGSVIADPESLAGSSVDVRIETASIDTGNDRRDNHLRSEDFFDADGYPEIRFRSRDVQVDGGKLTIVGDLTIRGITRPVTLRGQYLGTTTDQRGRQRIGFEATTGIDRHDFEVSWNNVAEGGGLVLGDEVQIHIVLAAVEQ